MQITQGRGNRRTTITIPTGRDIEQYAKDKPKDYQLSLANLCVLLGVDPEMK
jgi:hypothetical protein